MIKKLMNDIPTKIPEAARVIAVGDVHGQIHLLKQLVEESISFNPSEDVLVFMGDYIDRGPTSEAEAETINYVIDLANEHPDRIILLRGNHEQMALDALSEPTHDHISLWKMNGAGGKLQWCRESLRSLYEFCEALPVFIETDSHLFSHAGAMDGIPAHQQDLYFLLWDRFDNQEGYFGKTLVTGHTPGPDVRVSKEVICVDTGAFFTQKLSAYDVIAGRTFSASV